MKKMSEPIVFFGSGPVAAKSLQLLTEHFIVEAVITKPRPAHHKGDVPVLRVAKELGLAVLTATNKRSLDVLIEQHNFKSQVGVLIDFGIIVSQQAIDNFPLGIVNSHFSLLPEWRGADPITFSILSGQTTTGVSLMLLVQAMDEGPLLGFAEQPLSATVTTPELTDELIHLSDSLLEHLLPAYVHGTIQPQPQSNEGATYSRKLSKEDSIIDWHKPATQIEREIRAFIEWPKSVALIGGKDTVITRAHVVDETGKPGTFAKVNKQLVAYCGEKALVIDLLKPAGKKEMTGQAFLAGHQNV